MSSLYPLPEKFVNIRPHQQEAVDEAVEAYREGARVVLIDAPTGSGKSLIGEMVRRALMEEGIEGEGDIETSMYLCSSKGLQDQYAKDFTYGKVIKGRANYPTQYGMDDITCDDCTGKNCAYCDDNMCPYLNAKTAAATSELAILNYSYLLGEGNAGPDAAFKYRDFAIADECDELESELLNYIEFDITPYRLRDLQLDPPKKGSRKPTIADWLEGPLQMHAEMLCGNLKRNLDDPKVRRKYRSVKMMADEAIVIAKELREDWDSEDEGVWVRDYAHKDDGGLTLKPVKVDRWGQKVLWRHAGLWLLMSATIINPEELLDSAGWQTDDWRIVRVPMTFPVANRPVFFAPVGSMSAKNKQQTMPNMIKAVENLVKRYPDDRVLVHTHSYDIMKTLSSRCDLAGRPVFEYSSSAERDAVFRRYASTERAVLFAPSMDRGYDFAGELARCVILTKAPYPYLGDRRTSARMRLPGGRTWYDVQTARAVVQMTGRGVRGRTDYADSYILDADLMNLYRTNKGLFPSWWKDAVRMDFPTRELLSQ